MSSKISVSVIVPTFNQELYLGRCLRSLLNQTLERDQYEIIVVDDGSKKKTSTILSAFKDEISMVNNKKNMGLPYSLNKGIKIIFKDLSSKKEKIHEFFHFFFIDIQNFHNIWLH